MLLEKPSKKKHRTQCCRIKDLKETIKRMLIDKGSKEMTPCILATLPCVSPGRLSSFPPPQPLR